MFEEGGAAHLLFVVVTLGDDVFRSSARDGVTHLPVGVLHGEEVVAVGVVKRIPIDLRDLRVTVHPCRELGFDFTCAMGVGHVIARQVLVVVRTRVFGLTPFEGALSARTGEVIHRSLEVGLLARRPIPSEVGKRLMIGAHA